MNQWPVVCIGDLVDAGEAELQTGPFGTQLSASEYIEEGVPVVNVRNIGVGKLIDAKLEYISENTSQRLSIHCLQKHDLVFCRKGAVDRHLLVPECADGWIQGSDCMRLRINSTNVSAHFLSYYFSTNGHKDWMEAQCSFGATMSSLNQGVIRRIVIAVPSLLVQHRIVAVLSAYDELIENNNRRIALLEKMAEEVYREWFVRLRFPGHERVPVHQGVPEGWEAVAVGDAFEITGGGTPSKDESRFWDGGQINWFTPSDITAAKGIYLTDSETQCTAEGLAHSSARLFPPYCIMMTSRATIGALGINTTPACTNQGFITCIPNASFPLTYLYFWLKLNKGYFEMLSTGSTFLELIKSNFKRIRIVKPAPDVIDSYNFTTITIFNLIETLLQENKSLQHARDMLLPRLLSGKLDVEHLDIRFPPGMSERE